MKRAIAKKPVWIQVVWTGDKTVMSITDEPLPPFKNLKPYEGAHYMHLNAGELVAFENTLPDHGGYDFMVAHWPDWFEIIEVEE